MYKEADNAKLVDFEEIKKRIETESTGPVTYANLNEDKNR